MAEPELTRSGSALFSARCSRDPAARRPQLLRPKGADGIDARRTSCWNPGGCQGRHSQNKCRRRKDRWVQRLRFEQHARDRPRSDSRTACADRYSHGHRPRRRSHDLAHHLPVSRTECDADPDLPSALDNGVRYDAIHARHSDQQGDPGNQSEQQRALALKIPCNSADAAAGVLPRESRPMTRSHALSCARRMTSGCVSMDSTDRPGLGAVGKRKSGPRTPMMTRGVEPATPVSVIVSPSTAGSPPNRRSQKP